jgi:thymidylate synthase
MNKLDKQYTDLLQTILEHGVNKKDRTGTGTKSIFGYTIRHNMKDGFPLLTTKKMPFKTIVTELLWFLRGDTNIKYLVDNNCHIWDGDAYKNYLKNWEPQKVETEENPMDWMDQKLVNDRALPQDMFIHMIKTDDEFAKNWGELGPIYGKQWRKWKSFEHEYGEDENGDDFIGMWKGKEKIDQIQNLINDLKTNPDSRRMMVNAWNVGELDQMVLPPCHYGFQVYTRELSFNARYRIGKYQPYSIEDIVEYENGLNYITEEQFEAFHNREMDKLNIPTRAISLMWNQRSCDVPLGIPFNIASYGLLLEILARVVNMVPDQLIGNLGDCHIYLNQVEGCREQIQREGLSLPTFDCPAMDEIPYNTFDELVNRLLPCDFYMDDYQSHPTIKFPLSN